MIIKKIPANGENKIKPMETQNLGLRCTPLANKHTSLSTRSLNLHTIVTLIVKLTKRRETDKKSLSFPLVIEKSEATGGELDCKKETKILTTTIT